MTTPKRPEDFHASLLRVETLYSTPQVLAKATRLLKEPDASLDPVVDLIRRDAALAADVMRISNSSLFRRGEASSNVEEAVGRLGFSEVRRVLALSLGKNVFGKGLANYGVSAEDYWHESLLAALFMSALARRRGLDPDEAYLAGILHSIGKVLINEVLEDIGWSLFWDVTMPLDTWERQFVGFTHAEAGSLLLDHWGFPAAIAEAIRSQSAPESSTAEDTLGRLLRLARQCIPQVRPGSDFPSKPRPELVVFAGGEAEAEELLTEVRAGWQAVSQSLAGG